MFNDEMSLEILKAFKFFLNNESNYNKISFEVFEQSQKKMGFY